MTESVFGTGYADQYDLLYADKDYVAECDLVQEIFSRFSDDEVRSILDLGCGTGNHAISFAKRGYQVTGVDRSKEMLRQARQKGEDLPNAPVFIHGDVRTLDIGQKFDSVLMMFAVLGYQASNDDLLTALRTVRKHLRSGGLFVFDVWYGPAVLATRPSDRVKVIPTRDGRLIRAASGSLDTRHHSCSVRYHVLTIQGDRIVSETEETHTMRYFFPMELEFCLAQAGLQLQSLTAFPDLDKLADENSWNVIGVAK